VTAFFSGKPAGSYLVQLKVTDNTSLSFPSSGMPDLSDTASAQVQVKSGTDLACACVDDLVARAKDRKVDLTWSGLPAAHHYNVYRSMVPGGPYIFIGTIVAPPYVDTTVQNCVTYYYVVRPAALNGDELCQSNEASATPASHWILTARAKSGKVQLVWQNVGADHYNIYRGTVSGGPYLMIASTTSTYATYLDTAVVNGTTYYYVVRKADSGDLETCQSNEASATPNPR